jgi:hypothetical protein
VRGGRGDRLVAMFKAVRLGVTTRIDVDAQLQSNNESDLIAIAGGKWDTFPDIPVKHDEIFFPASGYHHAGFPQMMKLSVKNGKTPEDIILEH